MTQRVRRGRGRPPHPDILTPREWQVLDLLREGLSNEQIARRLDVSLAGAKYHVSEILTKLGLSSREEAAAWQPLPEPAIRLWLRAFAWVPRRAWPLAGAAGALAVLGAIAWFVFGASAGEDDSGVPAIQLTELSSPGPTRSADTPTPTLTREVEAERAAIAACIDNFKTIDGAVDAGDGVLQANAPNTVQARDVGISQLQQLQLTPADRANGIEWRFAMLLRWIVRSMNASGDWSEWRDVETVEPAVVVKKAGTVQVEGIRTPNTCEF